jgi:hypothetical protein
MANANTPVTCYESGLVVNPACPWLGASPDRKVLDLKIGFGLLEVKCPYSVKDITPQAACKTQQDFFCKEENGKFCLKKTHNYYAQIQGQMALGGAEWCDFLVYTHKGMLIERVLFDPDYWKEAYEKLSQFYVDYYWPSLAI